MNHGCHVTLHHPWRVGIPTTQEGLSIIDLVYASDRNKFRSDLINNVNVPWQQGVDGNDSQGMKVPWFFLGTLCIQLDFFRVQKMSNSFGLNYLRSTYQVNTNIYT